MQNIYKPATRLTLFAACFYESLVLIAICLAGTGLYVSMFGNALAGWSRLMLQILLWLLMGGYFVWCWRRSGQTLATQAWKIKLINAQHNTLSTQQACFRYALASASLLAFGGGFVWILFDKNGLFLHDRLLNTRFVVHT